MAKLPSVQITRGWISSICRNRWPCRPRSPAGAGSRLPGGRHLSTLAMKHCSRVSPISSSSWSSSLPARPTNGLPCWSSWNPGASPTNIRSASALPVPNTTVLRVRGQRALPAVRQLVVELHQLVAAGGGVSGSHRPLRSIPRRPPRLRHRLSDGVPACRVTDRTLNADISRAVSAEPHSGHGRGRSRRAHQLLEAAVTVTTGEFVDRQGDGDARSGCGCYADPPVSW